MTLQAIKISGTLLGVKVEGTWVPSDAERLAAWELYIELITRIGAEELHDDDGTLREALSSLHALFDITRGILRAYGPTVARPQTGGDCSMGYLAVAILNYYLRPFLSKWHPRLRHHESQRPATVSPVEHERAWADNPAVRAELRALRGMLIRYANLLAIAAEVPSLIIERRG